MFRMLSLGAIITSLVFTGQIVNGQQSNPINIAVKGQPAKAAVHPLDPAASNGVQGTRIF